MSVLTLVIPATVAVVAFLIVKGFLIMSELLDRAIAAAERQTTVTNSVIALLGETVVALREVRDALGEQQSDDAGLSAVIDNIEGNTDALAAAVAANTAGQGEEPAPPIEEPTPGEEG